MYLLTSVFPKVSVAQHLNLSGFVTEINSEKAIGDATVSVISENVKRKVNASDKNGFFSCQYPSSATSLIFEKIGFRALHVPLVQTLDKTGSALAGEIFFVRLPMIPNDQQASDRPYMQSEQKDFVLNTNQSGKKKVTRLFKVVNALSNQPVESAAICFEFTRVAKRECKDITPAAPSEPMIFEEADIINMVVESAGYQTYRGNLILEKMDGSNSIYVVRMTPEVTMLTLNVKNAKTELTCTLVPASGQEMRMNREGVHSFFILSKPGEYRLQVSNAKGGVFYSSQLTVARGLNYSVITLLDKPPVYRAPVMNEVKVVEKKIVLTDSATLPDTVKNVTLYFKQSEHLLQPESKEILDRLANWLKVSNSRQIRIVGHSDNVGDPKKNETLSEYRARVTFNYLQGKGVEEKQMHWAAIGSKRPVQVNDSEENKSKNRRVEITLFPEK